MKSLQESLFDKDINKKKVQVGELYKISDQNGDNCFSNDPLKFMSVFKSDVLKKWKYEFVDLDNQFISWYEFPDMNGTTKVLGLAAVMDMILQLPAEIFDNPSYRAIADDIKKELKPYINPANYKKLYVSVRKFNRPGMIEISISDDMLSSRPHSLKIMLRDK